MGGFNLGGINATGQVPSIPGNWGLIDLETPKDVYMKSSYHDPENDLQLVFSDEFNTPGRTFYPGDDPYWEGVDLHYWATNNLEWYDPAAITTNNGALEITLSRKDTHGLEYESGMMTTWNKFCFTGGLIEASVTLPGANNVVGLWPAIWTMGRAGYGASLEGMWPYTYDSCDVGTVANQTIDGLPKAASVNGDPKAGGAVSYLPGQRLSRCTCPGESHPGPVHSDGTFVGRSAPEIDVFEAQISGNPHMGQVSHNYQWDNSTETTTIANPELTNLNSYLGGAFQQATSALTTTNQSCYEFALGCFSIFGFEYQPGFDDAYISWIADDNLAWTLKQEGVGADDIVEISERPIPREPMYIIVNLGMSTNFGQVDLDHLKFPTVMRVDWIRVYQPQNAVNIGCNPKEYPTEQYIKQYIEAYTNPNLTTWTDDYKQPMPKNSFLKQCQ
ncbi:hypothetical protein H0H93_014143 [Arthromyces matolae]|nr:hypothetical protein H0H93_014143 [Arthromyces matolae]